MAVQRKDIYENIILIKSALEEPVSVRHQNNFAFIFEKPINKGDTCYDPSSPCKLSDQKIYCNKIKAELIIFLAFIKTSLIQRILQ